MSAPAPAPTSASTTSSPPQSPSQSLAQTMGFSAFGTAPNPPKRRKIHQDTESEGTGTGGNSIPLGRRREDGNAGDAGEEGEEGVVKGEEEAMALERLKTAALDRLGVAPTPILPPKPPTLHRHHHHHHDTPPEQQPLRSRTSEGAAAAQQGKDAVTAAAEAAPDWRAQLRKGVRDENGDVAFYDGSFVEDPWRGLVGGGG